MVNYGNGFTWTEVYTMPIHWRRFYFKKLLDAKTKEKADYDKVNKKGGSKGPNVRVRKYFLTFFLPYIYIRTII